MGCAVVNSAAVGLKDYLVCQVNILCIHGDISESGSVIGDGVIGCSVVVRSDGPLYRCGIGGIRVIIDKLHSARCGRIGGSIEGYRAHRILRSSSHSGCDGA